MKEIVELTEGNFEQETTKGPLPVVVDFYAPWCGPCKMAAPMVDQLAGQYAGRIQFFKVNIDDAPAVADRLGITAVPTFIFMRNGQVADTLQGVPPLRALTEKLDALAANAAAAAP